MVYCPSCRPIFWVTAIVTVRGGRCGQYALYAQQVRGNFTSSPNAEVGGIMDVQWLSFAGFYQKKIIKEFVHSATQHSITGFLAHGKPAVACLEGRSEDIKRAF